MYGSYFPQTNYCLDVEGNLYPFYSGLVIGAAVVVGLAVSAYITRYTDPLLCRPTAAQISSLDLGRFASIIFPFSKPNDGYYSLTGLGALSAIITSARYHY